MSRHPLAVRRTRVSPRLQTIAHHSRSASAIIRYLKAFNLAFGTFPYLGDTAVACHGPATNTASRAAVTRRRPRTAGMCGIHISDPPDRSDDETIWLSTEGNAIICFRALELASLTPAFVAVHDNGMAPVVEVSSCQDAENGISDLLLAGLRYRLTRYNPYILQDPTPPVGASRSCRIEATSNPNPCVRVPSSKCSSAGYPTLVPTGPPCFLAPERLYLKLCQHLLPR